MTKEPKKVSECKFVRFGCERCDYSSKTRSCLKHSKEGGIKVFTESLTTTPANFTIETENPMPPKNSEPNCWICHEPCELGETCATIHTSCMALVTRNTEVEKEIELAKEDEKGNCHKEWQEAYEQGKKIGREELQDTKKRIIKRN